VGAVLPLLSSFPQRQDCAQCKEKKVFAALLRLQKISAQKDLSTHVVSFFSFYRYPQQTSLFGAARVAGKARPKK